MHSAIMCVIISWPPWYHPHFRLRGVRDCTCQPIRQQVPPTRGATPGDFVLKLWSFFSTYIDMNWLLDKFLISHFTFIHDKTLPTLKNHPAPCQGLESFLCLKCHISFYPFSNVTSAPLLFFLPHSCVICGKITFSVVSVWSQEEETHGIQHTTWRLVQTGSLGTSDHMDLFHLVYLGHPATELTCSNLFTREPHHIGTTNT